MTAIEQHAYWIHHTKEDKTAVKGFIYLPQCKCSNCGYEANIEKETCPNCHAVMDVPQPKEAADN